MKGKIQKHKDFVYGLSIIIPTFNNIKTIKPLLNTLLYQKEHYYPETEIIVINDGSTENYTEIEKLPNIIYQKQINQGVSVARNVGLQLATRQYIAFVDSDDMVSPNYLHCIYQHFKEQKDCFLINWWWKQNNIQHGPTNNIVIYNNKEYRKHSNAVWSYVFKHSTLMTLNFDINKKINEDIDFLDKYFIKIHTTGYIKQPIYIYNLDNLLSLTHLYNQKSNINYKEEQNGNNKN